MRRSQVVPASVAAVLVLSCGVLATWMLSSAAEGGRKANAKVKPAPKVRSPEDEKVTTATLPAGLVTLRIDLKSRGKPGAKEPTTWDGSVSVSRGRIVRVRSWFDDPRDVVEGAKWQLTTRRTIPWNVVERAKGHAALPLKDSALVIELADASPETELSFQTEQGSFAFSLQDVPFGATKNFLTGLASATRMASAATILSAPTEDDYPSAALAPDGKLYVAYVAFTHGKDFRARVVFNSEPEDLKFLAQPTGGDQVCLLCVESDRCTGPIPVTPPGQDVFRTGLSIDGQGGVWVFWAAGRKGNWDLFGRRFLAGVWSREIRLTTDPGPDAFPAAVTDSSGRVWVAWQAFRANNSNILALRQEGDRFGEPITIADSADNEWAPAVAASADGRVAFAWDTYEKGDYDVYCRIWSDGKLGERTAVAATLEAEKRASVAFDAAGRLWIAYENSPEKWGKDWGALEKDGVALYQGRTVAVRVLAQGQLMQPADEPAGAFVPRAARAKPGRRGAGLALPRLTTDAKGRVWLAVRSGRLGTRVPVGPVWFEHAAWYEGDKWSGEIVCPGTDNILDNAPALVALASGEVALVGSSDGRMGTAGRVPPWFLKELQASGEKVRPARIDARWPDPVNNELTMARFGPASAGAAAPAVLEPVAAVSVAQSPAAKQEAGDVARARAARVTIAGRTLRLLRGEFHRHTELSQDGGGDGMLMDMWRYGLDAAAQDWIGNGDHDNGDNREYSWWITQKTTDLFHIPDVFSPMYTYERSCNYPDGHRNVVWAKRGVRTLPRLRSGLGKAMDELPPEAERPNSPDTLLLYRYLAEHDGVCASHTSGTDMGTDWRDNNAKVEPVVEIYQGCRQNYEMPGAPRSNTADNSIGGWRPYGFVSLAHKKGYRLGFQSSSDHVSTHMSYCNVWAEEHSSEAILAAMKARHVYGATDNIIADVRCGEHFMGEEFTLAEKPTLKIRLMGTAPFAKVHVIKDGAYVHTAEPNKQEVELQWTDFQPQAGKTSYYYVRGEQQDGELVWASPMWINYRP